MTNQNRTGNIRAAIIDAGIELPKGASEYLLAALGAVELLSGMIVDAEEGTEEYDKASCKDELVALHNVTCWKTDSSDEPRDLGSEIFGVWKQDCVNHAGEW